MKRVLLDLGDGTGVVTDLAPLKIKRAMRRLNRNLELGLFRSELGLSPKARDLKDLVVVQQWLDEQHQKYGDPKPLATCEPAEKQMSMSPEAAAEYQCFKNGKLS